MEGRSGGSFSRGSLSSSRTVTNPAEPPKRVRIEFSDSAADGDVELLRRPSWLLVPPSAREVNDLAWLIADRFNLTKASGEGRMLLEMEGFVLPLTESIDVVRDHDAITVKTLRDVRKRMRESSDSDTSASPSKARLAKKQRMENKSPEVHHNEKVATKDVKGNGKAMEKKKAKEESDEDEESEESSDTGEEAESSSSSEEESSSSDEEESSSSEEESEGDTQKAPSTVQKREPPPQHHTQSSAKPLNQAVTPASKGHVRFGPDGEVHPVPPPQQAQQQAQPPQWIPGHGRGRGFQYTPSPAPPPQFMGRGRGRGRGSPGPGFGYGRGRGWGEFPARGRGQGWGAQPRHSMHGMGNSSEHQAPAVTWASDLAYAAEFAGQPSSATDGVQRKRSESTNGHFTSAASPVYYSASLDWKKDTHPSYAPPPPLAPPKDYSSCTLFSDAGRNPRRGDVIAYQVLEMKDGGPSYSAHKEAKVEAYDAAKSVVTLRATTLASVPLDGSFVASEEDRAALFENTLDLAFDQLVDVRLVSS